MQFRLTSLFTAALIAAGSPMIASAQSGPIVPPPTPLGSSSAAQVAAPVAKPTPQTTAATPVGNTVAAPVNAQGQPAPAVLPPVEAPSINPAAVAPTSPEPAALLQVAIPSAPKPAAPQAAAVDLKPTVAGAKGVTTKKQAAKKDSDKKPEDADAKKAKLPADPFAGVIGTPVSDSQLNRFIFPEPVAGVYFQEGAPLPECPENASAQDPCKPVFLNGKRMMLLQLRAGAKGPVQMLTHLESGRVVTSHLMPTPGPGAIVRVDGAEDGPSDSRLDAAKSSNGMGNILNAQGQTQSEQYVEMLARFARGDIPAGFEAKPIAPSPIRFSLFDAIQKASWDNGAGLRAHMYQIKAHGAQPVAISAEMFRHNAVRALALDRETITASEPAYLFMLEMVAEEK